jgi:hypothetical protein
MFIGLVRLTPLTPQSPPSEVFELGIAVLTKELFMVMSHFGTIHANTACSFLMDTRFTHSSLPIPTPH